VPNYRCSWRVLRSVRAHEGLVKCDLEEFLAEVAEWLSDVRPVNPRDATGAVFAVLSRHIPEGQIAKVQRTAERPAGLLVFGGGRALSARPNRERPAATETAERKQSGARNAITADLGI